MRLLTKFSERSQASAFCSYLRAHKCECYQEQKAGEHLVWITHEDEFEVAKEHLTAFNSGNVIIPDKPSEKKPEKPKSFEVKMRPLVFMKRPHFYVTYLVLFVCVAVFIFSWQQQKTPSEKLLGLTPITETLLFDVPPALKEFATTVDSLNISSPDAIEKLDAEQKRVLHNAANLPYWRGVLGMILQPEDTNYRMFTDISKGQVWRLLTPVFLHANILHILFNMLWFFFLGKIIEPRLGIAKYLVLMLIVGVVANVAQYLISGPLFMGYSGIIVGMAAFIWIRQRKFPWEGYPMAKLTLYFLFAFVVGMAVLEVVLLGVSAVSSLQMQMGIANTAHIVGGITGLALGRTTLFCKGA